LPEWASGTCPKERRTNYRKLSSMHTSYGGLWPRHANECCHRGAFGEGWLGSWGYTAAALCSDRCDSHLGLTNVCRWLGLWLSRRTIHQPGINSSHCQWESAPPLARPPAHSWHHPPTLHQKRHRLNLFWTKYYIKCALSLKHSQGLWARRPVCPVLPHFQVHFAFGFCKTLRESGSRPLFLLPHCVTQWIFESAPWWGIFNSQALSQEWGTLRNGLCFLLRGPYSLVEDTRSQTGMDSKKVKVLHESSFSHDPNSEKRNRSTSKMKHKTFKCWAGNLAKV
jgi:hypothetical protein